MEREKFQLKNNLPGRRPCLFVFLWLLTRASVRHFRTQATRGCKTISSHLIRGEVRNSHWLGTKELLAQKYEI